jgi:hypothetical protein
MERKINAMTNSVLFARVKNGYMGYLHDEKQNKSNRHTLSTLAVGSEKHE